MGSFDCSAALAKCSLRALPCLVVVALSAAACPTYTVIPDADRAAIEDTHTGELLFLKQSMYVGQFYDDDRFRLVHPRRFEELTYLQTAEGDAIPPPPAEGIIPAGTRVRVERIEFPTGDAVFRRPLYTPRYTTWILLRVARERGPEVTVERAQRHVLLIPAGIADEETFDSWFGASLTTEDPNPWLLSLPEPQRNAILQKQATLGMDYQALTAAWGFPDQLARKDEGQGSVEGAVYGARSVVLKDGIIVRISDPTAPAAAAPDPAQPAPTEPAPPAPAEPASTEPASTEPAPLETREAAPIEGNGLEPGAPLDAAPAASP
jgi:hypothetical protein